MSRADPKRPERGTTLVELMAVVAVTGILTVAMVKVIASSRNSLSRHENTAEIFQRHQRMSANMRASLSPASLILGDYSPEGGHDYSEIRDLVKASVAASNTPAPVPFSKPPAVLTLAKAPVSGTAVAANAAYWGNELMYIVNVKPVTFTVSYDPVTYTTVLTDLASVDRIQFVYLYLSYDPSLRITGMPQGGLRIVEWRSQPLVKVESLEELTDPLPSDAQPWRKRKTKTCAILAGMGYTKAFDIAQAHSLTNSAFYSITGTAPVLTPTAAPLSLSRSTWAYLEDFEYQASFLTRPGLDQRRVSLAAGNAQSAGPSRMALAYNTVDPDIDPTFKFNRLEGPGRSYLVPAFAQMNAGGLTGFPGGLEIIVVGKPKAREVYIRKVLTAISYSGYRFKPKTFQGHEFIDIVAVRNDR